MVITITILVCCDLAGLSDQSAMWLYCQEPIKVSHHPAKFGGHEHSGSENVFLVWLHNQRVMWLYGWEPFMVSHHPAKFGGPGNCSSQDIF